jgi:hypothetical protein
MKIIEKLKNFWFSLKNKYVVPPIEEKFIELKKSDQKLYERRIKQEVNKVVKRHYVIPASIISVFSLYSLYYYISQLVIYIGGYK